MSFRFILIYVSKSSHFNINLSTFFFGCDNIFIALATLLTKYYNFSAIQMFEQKKTLPNGLITCVRLSEMCFGETVYVNGKLNIAKGKSKSILSTR